MQRPQAIRKQQQQKKLLEAMLCSVLQHQQNIYIYYKLYWTCMFNLICSFLVRNRLECENNLLHTYTYTYVQNTENSTRNIALFTSKTYVANRIEQEKLA